MRQSRNSIGARLGLLAIALISAFAAPSALAGTISLRTSAIVPQRERGIRLADIANLEGADAEAFSDLVVIDASAMLSHENAWREVKIETVRAALQKAGANMGRMAISGARCLVRIEGARVAEAQPPAPEEPPVEEVGQVITSEALPTIRGRVAEALAELFGVERTEIRFKFDPRDEALLAQTEWGRRIAVQPVSGTSSSRVVVDVRIYAGDRLVESSGVRVDVEVRRRVVTLLQTVQRKSELTPDVLTEGIQWLPPGGAAPVSGIAAAVGSIARTRLEAGSVLRESELEAPIMVRRNELVTVHCLRAGFEVRTRARAGRDAARGDVIEFTLEGSRKPFLARVDGPGRAIVNLDAGQPLAAVENKVESR